MAWGFTRALNIFFLLTWISTYCFTEDPKQSLRRYDNRLSNCLYTNLTINNEIHCPNQVTIEWSMWEFFMNIWDGRVTINCHSNLDHNFSLSKKFLNIFDIKRKQFLVHILKIMNCSMINSYIEYFLPTRVINSKQSFVYLSGNDKQKVSLKFHEAQLVEFDIGAIHIINYPIDELPTILFPNVLYQLIITKTNIATLPESIFWNTHKLEKLTLNNNEINHLPKMIFRELRRLQILSLSDNQLGQIELGTFDSLEKLETLQLDRNTLTALPVGLFNSLLNLQNLDLSNNKLIHINGLLCRLGNLNFLDVSNNPLLGSSTTTNNKCFTMLSSLRSLTMKNCGIMDISSDFLMNAHDLQSLDLSSNHIQLLPESFLNESSKVQRLLLDNNYLKHIPLFLYVNRNFTELSLANNSLEKIPVDLLKNLFSLNLFNVGHNKIQSLQPDSFRFTEASQDRGNISVSSDNTILLSLNLNNNGIEEILPNTFQYLTQLLVLDLSHNRIQQLQFETFLNLHYLRELYVNHNQLDNVTNLFDPLVNVEIINLSSNNLASVEESIFRNNINLKELDLSYNKLKSIKTFSNHDKLVSLKKLYLNNNEMNFVDSPSAFSSLDGLTHINLANNSLEMFSMQMTSIQEYIKGTYSFPYLQHLDLSNNSISRLGFKWRLSFSKLKYFGLAFNKITKLSADDLRYASYNLSVDLQNNLIESVDIKFSEVLEGAQETNSSVTVNLNYNPLYCSCDLFKLLRLHDHDISLTQNNFNVAELTADKLSCSAPTVLEGSYVQDFEDWAPNLLSLFGLCLL